MKTWPTLGLAAVALLATGCLSFRAVTATGKLGVRVGEHRESFDELYDVCLESAAMGASSVEGCGEIPPARTNVVAGMRAIAAYGAALQNLAEAEDPDVEDNVTAAVEAMPFEGLGDLASPTGQLIGALTQLLTQTYRQGQLREVIALAQPTIRDLATILESVMVAWADTLTTMKALALREMQPPNSPTLTERFGLAAAAGHAGHELLRIEAAIRAIRAFAAAHAELEQSGDLSAVETLVLVVETAFRVGGAAVDLGTSGGGDPEEPDDAPEDPSTEAPVPAQ